MKKHSPYKGRRINAGKIYKTDKEAAKAVDMYLIRKGKNPVNILKKKL